MEEGRFEHPGASIDALRSGLPHRPLGGRAELYKRIPPELRTYFGWKGLYAGISEGICAPMNEVETYNHGFRDVARDKK